MAYQKVFKRYELKYMLTREQKDRVVRALQPYMSIDQYGKTTIRNIYFDTPDYILARHSIVKPDFKEKLRVRSYTQVSPDGKVFVELKRKFDHVVYKRRVAIAEKAAMEWTTGAKAYGHQDGRTNQLCSEINYFLDYYKDLQPVMFLSYDREAYKMRPGLDDQDFRVTFDENVLCRDHDMSLCSEAYGTPILESGKVLMELKCSGGIPLWMVSILSEEKLYKTSFSKYGTAYTQLVIPEMAEAAAASVLQRQAAGETEAETAEKRSPHTAPEVRKRAFRQRMFPHWTGFMQAAGKTA